MRFFKKNKILTILLIILSVYIYNNFTRVVDTNELVDRKSEHYINDLYASDGRIYEKYLDEDEKKLYKTLVNNTKTYKSNFDVKLKDYNCNTTEELREKLYNVCDAVLVDHPELMNYGGISWKWRSGDEKISVTLSLAFSNQLKEVIGQLKIQRVIADIKRDTKNMTDQEKIKYVYDWIGNNTKYDRTFTYFSKNQSIYNVFMKGNAVCAAFSKASQIIFQNIGIESYCISGTTSGPHMWNIVKLDGKYYYYDSTVASCIKKSSKHFYDGLKQEEFKGYSQEHPKWYKDIKLEENNGLYK